MSRACVLYISNKVHARYMRVEDALNAFGTRSMNVHTYIHTYKPYWLSWVHGYNNEVHFECLDILMLGKSPIKWRQRPDMTIALSL